MTSGLNKWLGKPWNWYRQKIRNWLSEVYEMYFHWSTFRQPLIAWTLSIHKLDFSLKADMDKLFAYISFILEIGETEGVLHLKQDFSPSRYAYIENLKQIYEQGKSFVVLRKNLGFPITETTLCYQTSRGIQESRIDDIGEIQFNISQSLNKSFLEFDYFLSEAHPPLHIWGSQIRVNDRFSKIMSTFHLNIAIFTDIWFPWVMDYNLDRDNPYIDEKDVHHYPWHTHNDIKSFDDLYDNRGLAEQHTPRLNRFLSQAFDATKEYGEVEVEKNFEHVFSPMITNESLIRLDVKPRCYQHS